MLRRPFYIVALIALTTATLTGCGGGGGFGSLARPRPTATGSPLIPGGPAPGSPSPTASPSPGALHFLVRSLGMADGTSTTIRTGFSFNGTPYAITIVNPQSGITAQWTGGDLHVQAHCPTFTPATDITITDNSGNKGSINVACSSIAPGQTSYASPFLITAEPKAHQDVFVYGLGQPITIKPHDTSVSSVAAGAAQAQFTITTLAPGTDGVTFQDNANPPNSAGVTVNVVAANS